ncbi:MAG: hypothetical protein AAF362_14470 [Pseudomonadota bacterium]
MTVQQNDDEEEAPLDPAMARVRKKMIRLLVISMSIMIIGLLSVFGAIIYKIGSNGNDEEQVTAGGAQIEPGVDSSLELPAGATIKSMSLDGLNVLLQLELPDGTRQLLVYGINDQRILATITVE